MKAAKAIATMMGRMSIRMGMMVRVEVRTSKRRLN